MSVISAKLCTPTAAEYRIVLAYVISSFTAKKSLGYCCSVRSIILLIALDKSTFIRGNISLAVFVLVVTKMFESWGGGG
ncbi:MAG: hypothetical protein LBI80_03370 [Endomicrobium sp.]|jgi:hypothetical protein|nr:hypothetical protein [Endomicrobium sp.]